MRAPLRRLLGGWALLIAAVLAVGVCGCSVQVTGKGIYVDLGRPGPGVFGRPPTPAPAAPATPATSATAAPTPVPSPPLAPTAATSSPPAPLAPVAVQPTVPLPPPGPTEPPEPVEIVPEPPAGSTTFYVATTGSDTNVGSLDQPFATLRRARNAIRALKKPGPLPEGGITVWIRGGRYHLTETFRLTKEDSGTATAPVVYRSHPGEEVRLIGGREITGWKPVTDPAPRERLDPAVRDQVLEAALKPLGITDYGASAMGQSLELFCDDQPMPLARWPNQGWAYVDAIPENDGRRGEFFYAGDRPQRWQQATEVWIEGYLNPGVAYSADRFRVRNIDLTRRLIQSATPFPGYGIWPGGRYVAINLLEELDAPGEWYLERPTGILYFLPPASAVSPSVYVSELNGPLVLLRDTAHIVLRDLIIEIGRANGVQIIGGRQNLVVGCTLRNLREEGVCIGKVNRFSASALYINPVVNGEGGTSNGVVACEITQTGTGGIILGGGDRVHLEPAGNFAVNNHLHHLNRIERTAYPAIHVYGVGNRVAHNLIHDLPHWAILLNGNDQWIEDNEIHNVCTETDDAGAIYCGRDLSEQGNVIRRNYIHDLPRGGIISAVYLDDWESGFVVDGNVCARLSRGVTIGAGSWNTVTNNIFWDLDWGVLFDTRGDLSPVCIDRLRAANYQRPPYSVRYPNLRTVLDQPYTTPRENHFERNIVRATRPVTYDPAIDTSQQTVTNNLVNVDPGFAQTTTFGLREDSPARQLGFQPIPFTQIGLYVDEYRPTLPAR